MNDSSSHLLLSRASDFFEKEDPELWKLIYPRAYVQPPGYPSARWHAAMIGSHLIANQKYQYSELKGKKTAIDYTLCDWKLLSVGVPTYYIAGDFATALTATEPPPGMKMKDLKWPEEAMVFVLPEKFQMEYFGVRMPFIRIAKITTGRQYAPKEIQKVITQPQGTGLGYAGSFGVVCTGIVLVNDEVMVDYSGSYDEESKIEDILKDTSFDNPDLVLENYVGEFPIEKDLEIVRRMFVVALQLLIAMAALPKYIEQETIIRPEKIKKGSIRRALYRPRMVGEKYVIKREKIPQGGSHSSPILHRRTGHWRSQIYGPTTVPTKDRPHKTIWIEPVWVGARE